jgi:hypothetical protein
VAVKERSNDQWLAALRGPNRDEALAELRVELMRGLRAAFKALIGEIADTRDVESGCDACFEQLDRFVEIELSGLNAAQAMPLVQEHVEICGECREEFEALRATGES